MFVWKLPCGGKWTTAGWHTQIVLASCAKVSPSSRCTTCTQSADQCGSNILNRFEAPCIRRCRDNEAWSEMKRRHASRA